MTTYRLFPATNGPASPINFTGNFIAGVNFAVAGGGNWFDGYWWWVANSGQSTAAVKCALWSMTAPGVGVLIPGSVVTSGTLTAGQWNYIPLSVPLQLAPGYDPANNPAGSSYVAAIGVNGSFPDTGSFWGSAIVNGPLVGYAAGSQPYTTAQGCFTVGGSDPSLVMPSSSSNTDNFWVDVQIDTVAPVYSGSYRLWPNKWDASPATTVDTNVDYVVATEIHLTEDCRLNAIHYFSPASAASLATACDVWDIGTQSAVASIASPTWLTEAGGAGSAASGWLKAAFAGGTVLPAGSYRVSVYNSNGVGGGWNAKDASSNYFITGAGNAGITWGPLFAPNFAGAALANVFNSAGTTHGQPVFAVGPPDQYPNVSTGNAPAQVYWVDLEVTPVPANSGVLLSCFP